MWHIARHLLRLAETDADMETGAHTETAADTRADRSDQAGANTSTGTGAGAGRAHAPARVRARAHAPAQARTRAQAPGTGAGHRCRCGRGCGCGARPGAGAGANTSAGVGAGARLGSGAGVGTGSGAGAGARAGTVITVSPIAEDRTFADIDDDELVSPDDARIGTALPLSLGDSLAAWSEIFADYEIMLPFPQLGRDVHRLTEEERKAVRLARFEGLTAPGAQGRRVGVARLATRDAYGQRQRKLNLRAVWGAAGIRQKGAAG
jgi:hypothetical protein